MKPLRLPIIFALMVLSLFWQAGNAQEISFTSTAQGLLEFKNISSSNALFQDDEILNILLQTTCAEDVSKIVFERQRSETDFNITSKMVSQTRASQDRYNFLFNLQIEIDERTGTTDPMALELREATVAWLQEFMAKKHRETLEEQAERLAYAERTARQAESRLKKLQAEQQALFEKGGQSTRSRSRIQGEIRDLEQKKQQLEMEQTGMRARSRALEEQIAKIGVEIEEKIAKDPILEELEKLLDLRLKDLERAVTLQQRGVAGADEVSERQAEVAQARIEIARRRELIGETAQSGELLSNWNMQLADLSIRRAELEAEWMFILNQLNDIKKRNLLELADQIENLEREIQNARSNFTEASQMVRNVQREMERNRAPKVSILGSN